MEADKPEAYGGNYAWGETVVKDNYNWDTYQHVSSNSYQDLGSDIAGTPYDVAHVKWGGIWVMPSQGQMEELVENCDYKWTTVDGVEGQKFTSRTNGGTIFLPAAGLYWHDVYSNYGREGLYWSSTQRPWNLHLAYKLDFNSDDELFWNAYDRICGYSVRPVSK